MKLLLDENLSLRLLELLTDVYAEMEHIAHVGLSGADDERVWAYAKNNGFVLVSKDSDFADMSVLRGSPPKVVWVRLGNCTTAAVEFLLRNSVNTLQRFAGGEETCLTVGRVR